VRSLSLWRKIWSCPPLSLARIQWRGTWVVYRISLYVLCSVLHYLCGIYPDIANTRDDYSLFFCGLTNQLGPRPPHFWVVCITHNDTHTPGSRTPLQGWSARRRGRYLHNTQHSQQTNIHAISRIRIQQSSRCRPPPETARPTRSAH